MKKILLFCFVTLFSVSIGYAAGGFNGELINNSTTVIQALNFGDDTYVTLKGNIIKKISSDKYLFKDATGTMTVEIDDDKWLNQEIKEGDTVELYGEIEKKLNSTKLDVESVRKLSK